VASHRKCAIVNYQNSDVVDPIEKPKAKIEIGISFLLAIH